MRVKICGITNLEDALLSCQFGADALGFIFYEKSKRYISYEKAEEIIRQMPSFVVKVGVFVDQNIHEINEVSQKIGLNTVQLHSDVSTDFVKEIKLPVIKSFRVNSGFDFSQLKNYPDCSFLLDTFSDDVLGGTGKIFNWDLIPSEWRNKIILAGGISLNNIEYIYRNINPQAVDLSSSLESFPGKKDNSKLKEFLNKVNKLRYVNE